MNNIQCISENLQEQIQDFNCDNCGSHLCLDWDADSIIQLLYKNTKTAKSASTGEKITVTEYKECPQYNGQRPAKVRIALYCAECVNENAEKLYYTMTADLKNINIKEAN